MLGEIRLVRLHVMLECILVCVIVRHAGLQERPYGWFSIAELFVKIVCLAVLQADDRDDRPGDDLLRRHVRLQWRERGGVWPWLPRGDAAAKDANG